MLSRLQPRLSAPNLDPRALSLTESLALVKLTQHLLSIVMKITVLIMQKKIEGEIRVIMNQSSIGEREAADTFPWDRGW